MFGSIYIGLSGLIAYSDGLKAVSNNVSNLNTTGFKSTNVKFYDIYSSGGQGGLEYGYKFAGGGRGVGLHAESINFSQGDLRQTDRDLDLAIDGNGFFVLRDGDQFLYARTGSFIVDEDGFVIMDGTDYRLSILDRAGRPADVNIDAVRSNPPAATDRITFADNLSSTATTYSIPDLKVYNAGGEESVWTINFSRAETAAGIWTVKVTDATGKDIGQKELKFISSVVDPATSSLVFEDAEKNLSVTFDFSSGVTSFSSGTVSSLRASKVTGHPAGMISSMVVNQSGKLEVLYNNDERTELGALAIADFRDPQRLEKRSNGLYFFDGYGQRQLLAAGDSRVGSVLSRRLEGSNVDLSGQFSDLILIQRGFQASSQIISVSNEMIQQLFGIRGQG